MQCIGFRPDRRGAVARRFAGSAEVPPPWAHRKASYSAAGRLAGPIMPTSLPTLGAKAPPDRSQVRTRPSGPARGGSTSTMVASVAVRMTRQVVGARRQVRLLG
jgi:hypothetical protein